MNMTPTVTMVYFVSRKSDGENNFKNKYLLNTPLNFLDISKNLKPSFIVLNPPLLCSLRIPYLALPCPLNFQLLCEL